MSRCNSMPRKQTRVDGINCPKCGSRVVHTVDSRPNGKCRRRRYICECGERFSTAEVPFDKFRMWTSMEKHLGRIRQTINSALTTRNSA